MRITPAVEAGRLVVEVEGWLDQNGANELERLCREAPRPLCLSLDGLRDVDTDGLDVLSAILDSDLDVVGLHPYVELLLDDHRSNRPSRSEATIRVLTVDDDGLTRQVMAAYFEEMTDIELIGEAKDGHRAIEEAGRLRPDVILMDVSMPVLDGIDATRTILERSPDTGVVLLTGLELDARVLQAVRAGASGYLPKGCQFEEISAAIRSVHGGGTYLPASITRGLLSRWHRRPSGSLLTPREAEIVGLVAQGLKNQQIADRLCLASATIRTHLAQIYDKLTLTNRVELTLFALREGLATLEEPVVDASH